MNPETRAETLPLTSIVAAKDNVHARESASSETMQGLVESIRANGLIHRLVVRPDVKSGKFVIVDGHRRYVAAKAAGMAEVPVEIRDMDDGAALAVTVAANVQRMPNDPILEAEAIEKMLKSGMSRADIAAAIGKSEGYVARRARLIGLAQPWRAFARRIPCTTDMLEKVAAHEAALQERVAADVDLDNYCLDSDGGACAWGEFADVFSRAMMRIGDAVFDTADCAKCPKNTACHAFLFDFMQTEEGASARCQDATCYVRKNEKTVDALLADLKRRGTPAIEVADKWRVPQYWDMSEAKNRKHPQAYVFADGGIRRVKWSVPKADADCGSGKVALTAEEKAARKEAKRRAGLVRSARDKLREMLKEDESGRIAIFETALGGAAFDRIAERRFNRELRRGWIPDELCDDLMREFSHGECVQDALTKEELETYEAELESNGPEEG